MESFALAASGLAVLLYAKWLLGVFMHQPEDEYEACNRVMGTRFKSDAEYRASRFGK